MNLMDKWRWRALAIWIVVFTCFILYLGLTNKHNIQDLKNTKANIVQLNRTNDRLHAAILQLSYSRLAVVCSVKDGPMKTKSIKSIQDTFNFVDKIYGGHHVAKCNGERVVK